MPIPERLDITSVYSQVSGVPDLSAEKHMFCISYEIILFIFLREVKLAEIV